MIKGSFKNLYLVLLLLSLTIVISGCEKDDNKVMNSQKDGTDSHKHGEDCMSCHSSGGSGEGVFTIAGSIYNDDMLTPYPNGTVELKIDIAGSVNMVKTLEVDARGNFYTTDPFDFSEGAYTSIWSINGKEYDMNSKISSGSCNSCHGNSTEKLWIK